MKYVLWTIAGLGALVVLAVLGLFLYGMRGDAGRLRGQTTIAAAPNELWPWLRDGEKLKSWVGWLVEVRIPDAGSDGFGTRQVWVMEDRNNGNQRMEIEGRVVELQKPVRLVIAASTPGAFSGRHIYTLADAGGGRTQVEVEGMYEYHHPIARLMGPIITSQAEKKLVEDLARLRSLVESRRPSTAAR